MKATSSIPGLDRPATYEIVVPGRLDESWSDWLAGMTVEVMSGDDGPTITTLTGVVADQAALQGLLSRLYALGLSLISVHCVEPPAIPTQGQDQTCSGCAPLEGHPAPQKGREP